MLVSHSPPIFSHSPPTGYLQDNTSFRSSLIGMTSLPRLHRAASFPLRGQPKIHSLPTRPILVVRTGEDKTQSVEDSSPTKSKKHVVFADDKGMSLTHVRMMTEPSNVPPTWSKRFLSEVTRGITAEPLVPNNTWETMFSPPASDYINFRQKLDSQNVCLERAAIEDEKHLVGTVKVVNLSFEKDVFVRLSQDDWVTNDDVKCSYVPSSLPSSIPAAAYVVYDTFKFSFKLPTKARKIEFCICYKTSDNEYWDNNDNKNYLLLKRIQILPRSNSCENFLKAREGSKQDEHLNTVNNYLEATQIRTDSWSEFASWTHLENSSPYW